MNDLRLWEGRDYTWQGRRDDEHEHREHERAWSYADHRALERRI